MGLENMEAAMWLQICEAKEEVVSSSSSEWEAIFTCCFLNRIWRRCGCRFVGRRWFSKMVRVTAEEELLGFVKERERERAAETTVVLASKVGFWLWGLSGHSGGGT